MRLAATRLVVVVLAASLAACAAQFERPPRGEAWPEDARDLRERILAAEASGGDPWLIVRGARVFDERCSPCHGETGRGDGVLVDALPIRPRNYREDRFKWGTRVSDVATTVIEGRSGVMPSFRGALSEDEVLAVAYLVWSWLPPERRERDAAEDLEGWSSR